MPYIAKEDRSQYGPALAQLSNLLTDQPKGHLTYVLYVLANRFIRDERYTDMSEARSALQDAADELYRSVMAPYEDKQKAENGDAT